MEETKEVMYHYTRVVDGKEFNLVTPSVELAFARTHSKVESYDDE